SHAARHEARSPSERASSDVVVQGERQSSSNMQSRIRATCQQWSAADNEPIQIALMHVTRRVSREDAALGTDNAYEQMRRECHWSEAGVLPKGGRRPGTAGPHPHESGPYQARGHSAHRG